MGEEGEELDLPDPMEDMPIPGQGNPEKPDIHFPAFEGEIENPQVKTWKKSQDVLTWITLTKQD